jgi:pre-mRNA-splicing factor SYF2
MDFLSSYVRRAYCARGLRAAQEWRRRSYRDTSGTMSAVVPNQGEIAQADTNNEDSTNNPEQPENQSDDDVSLTAPQQPAWKQRLRRLKQKMNQARQLNKQAVREEGERLSEHGIVLERKRLAAQTKQAKTADWEKQHAKALVLAAAAGVDAKQVTEQAVDSVNKATRRLEQEERNQYSVNDYHNPEGQFRNYERNIKSLSVTTAVVGGSHTASSSATYNPLDNLYQVDPEQERQGAQRLAAEMQRRVEKRQNRELQKRVRDDVDASTEDVSYINQRNKKFNEKISRSYDKHTAEIRNNLERGTAL